MSSGDLVRAERAERGWITSVNHLIQLANGAAADSAVSAEPTTGAVQSIARGALPPNVAQYVAAATASATRRAYVGDLKDFLAWGGCVPCSPTALASYIADRALVHSPSTVMRRVVGVAKAHTTQGFPDPSKTDLVRAVMRGVRRVHGKPQRQARPLLPDELGRALGQAVGIRGLRDRALILVGFAAALRRSELVALDIENVIRVPEGMVILIRRSKTDQLGVGRRIAVPNGLGHNCPVPALERWVAAAGICEGAIFRAVDKGGRVSAARLTAQSVSLVVKARVAAVGMDPEMYSGHSLRAGLATSAARAGVGLLKIQEQTGHRSLGMLARYVREANAFEENAAGAVLGVVAATESGWRG